MSTMPPEDISLGEVAFIGRSNVGKSSLINMLTNRKGLAFTSKTPGKTSEFNFFEACGRTNNIKHQPQQNKEKLDTKIITNSVIHL